MHCRRTVSVKEEPTEPRNHPGDGEQIGCGGLGNLLKCGPVGPVSGTGGIGAIAAGAAQEGAPNYQQEGGVATGHMGSLAGQTVAGEFYRPLRPEAPTQCAPTRRLGPSKL